jgi:hypothetical protein
MSHQDQRPMVSALALLVVLLQLLVPASAQLREDLFQVYSCCIAVATAAAAAYVSICVYKLQALSASITNNTFSSSTDNTVASYNEQLH